MLSGTSWGSCCSGLRGVLGVLDVHAQESLGTAEFFG
jgi:hypothetical protein